MKIAILGSRGIPNAYGGFEQYAEMLSQYLIKNGCEVYVYCSSTQPYKEKTYKHVNLKHCYDPEPNIGTAGQFVYDLNCILDARREKFDIIYQLGYTSSAVFNWLMPKKCVLITNMDGMEWQRSKYSKKVQRFLKWSESLVVRHSHYLIADALPIQAYLQAQYNKSVYYSAYTSELPQLYRKELLQSYHLEAKAYTLLIARMEPENNIEMILQAYVNSNRQEPLIVIGKTENKHGQYLQSNFRHPKIRFLGGVYNKEALDTLRHFSALYFHGHSVGGTNPSLLEAMACSCHILAHDNVYNKSVLHENGIYFSNAAQLTSIIEAQYSDSEMWQEFIAGNQKSIAENYSEQTVFAPLLDLFRKITGK